MKIGTFILNKKIIKKKQTKRKKGWELDVDFPSWKNTEIYVKTISKGYLLLVKNLKMRIGELKQELFND